jgi:hypothetical protein
VELIPARPFVARKADFAPEARPGLFASIGNAIGRRSLLMLSDRRVRIDQNQTTASTSQSLGCHDKMPKPQRRDEGNAGHGSTQYDDANFVAIAIAG